MKHTIIMRDIETLIPYARNARTHSPAQVAQLMGSIQEFGFTAPVLIHGNGILAGHGRVQAARSLGMKQVPCIDLSHLTKTQAKAYILADNQLALNAGWDNEMLSVELAELKDEGFDLDLLGFDDLEGLMKSEADGKTQDAANATLAERFGVPPFSILDSRQGYWQDRKRAWLALGIKSEVGRGDNLLKMSDTLLQPDPEKRKKMQGKTFGNASEYLGEREQGQEYEGGDAWQGSGTSIFDPVLCELAYRWFCPPCGRVLDPFAGGSVRGVVAGLLGRRYTGLELRAEQVEANRAQGEAIFKAAADKPKPEWITTDSLQMDAVLPMDFQADMILSCPPYADLEVYSEDPADISNKAYPEFMRLYSGIIQKSVARLKPNGFIVWVIGDVRGGNGNYYGFVPDTINAFQQAGAAFYNEGILVNAVGSAAIRAARTFEASRKLCKVHQNVLVFIKGDAKKATRAIGDVEFGDVPAAEAQGVQA